MSLFFEEAINPGEKASVDRSVFPFFSFSSIDGNSHNVKEFYFGKHTVPGMDIFDSRMIDVYSSGFQDISSVDDLLDITSSGKSCNIKLSNSITIEEQIKISSGQDVVLQLSKDAEINGTGNVGGNGRLFQVENGKLTVNGNGAKIIAPSSCYGAFRVETSGSLELNNIVIENSRKNGLNVKVLGGHAVLNNVTCNSTVGGGVEVTEAKLGEKSSPGHLVLNNCNFTQKEYGDWCSTCLSVSGGSYLIVNGGKYISENWALYVFSSGGSITVNNGTFVGNRNGECMRAEIDLNSYPGYTGGFKINGGSFDGNAHVISPAYLVINKGSFTFDPSQYVSQNKSVTVSGDRYVVA